MLDKKFNEVIEELDKNMESKADAKYARVVITELTLMYLDEIHKLELDYEKRLKLCNAKLKDLVITKRKISFYNRHNSNFTYYVYVFCF